MIIEARFPRVLEVLTFVGRLNGSNSKIPSNCNCQPDNLLCNCSHLAANNNGVYTIHISFNVTKIGYNPDWCSNNVTVIVQGKERMYRYAIYTYMCVDAYNSKSNDNLIFYNQSIVILEIFFDYNYRKYIKYLGCMCLANISINVLNMLKQ